MTISTEVRKAGPFIGNDSASVFPFAFKVFKAADLIVVRRQDNIGEETTLVLDSDYHVTLNGNQDTTPGGVVALVAGALASGFTLVVSSELPYLQPTDLTNQGGFYPKVITNALDRLTIFCQQLAEITGRTLKLPITAPTNISAEIPLPNPSELIAWNETGTGLTTVSPQSLVTRIAYGSATADLFAGDGVTTTFPLTTNPASVNNLDVSVGGFSQRPVQGGVGDYSWNGGASITFVVPPPAPTVPGDKNVLVRYMQAIPVSDSEALHAQTREALRRSYADAGYNLVGGSFETGGTLASTSDVLLLESAGVAYAWTGAYPVGGYDVAPGIDPTVVPGFALRSAAGLRNDLASPAGLKLIGEVSDVSALRLLVGNSGDKIYLASYNSGWAAVSSAPVGGGKFRWVADNALLDDGVFVFKPDGASGAWVRQYQKKVTPYLAGAKGDNVDDTAAMLRCFNVATSKRLNVHIDKGQYKYTQTPVIGQECNVSGELSVSELSPVGCDGIKFTSSDAVGGRKVGGFIMFGTGANDAGYTAIVCDPGQDVSKRTTGVSFEDIQIFNFKTAGNFKNLWHSTFRSVNATNVCNGFVFRGRCVSNEVGSGTKIVRGSGALVSGECIGAQFIASSDYSPAVEARPEGCSITSSVLVFGFDVAVDVDSMLVGGIFGADLDYCRSFGVRYRNWDGRPTIAPNWIAGDAGYSAQPFIGVYGVPKPAQSTSGPDIKQITMTTFNGNAGDAGVKLGSLNGRATVSNCLISNSAGIGIYDNAGRFNAFKDNMISSPTPIFMFETGANEITGNTIAGGVIADINPIGGNLWGRNSGEYFTEGVVVVPIPAFETSASINLAALGYPRGIPDSGERTAMCYYTGGISPGNTWADISGDGLTVTAYKTVAFGSASELYVRIGLA